MGKLIAITGPMFSGKTSELIRLVRRFSIAKKKVQIFNPMMDTRYSKSDLLSHDNVKIATERVSDSAHLIRSVREESDVIAIDEGHFFDDGIIDVCETLANQGKTVIINFLNLNFLADPFPYSTNLHRSTAEILALADEVRHLTSICTHVNDDWQQCSQPATRSQRFVDGKPASRDAELIVVGAQESYAPRCRKHYIIVQ